MDKLEAAAAFEGSSDKCNWSISHRRGRLNKMKLNPQSPISILRFYRLLLLSSFLLFILSRSSIFLLLLLIHFLPSFSSSASPSSNAVYGLYTKYTHRLCSSKGGHLVSIS